MSILVLLPNLLATAAKLENVTRWAQPHYRQGSSQIILIITLLQSANTKLHETLWCLHNPYSFGMYVMDMFSPKDHTPLMKFWFPSGQIHLPPMP